MLFSAWGKPHKGLRAISTNRHKANKRAAESVVVKDVLSRYSVVLFIKFKSGVLKSQSKVREELDILFFFPFFLFLSFPLHLFFLFDVVEN